jgi:hypothetical protein
MARHRKLIKRAVYVLAPLMLVFYGLEQLRVTWSCRDLLSVLSFNVRWYRTENGEHRPSDIFCVANAFYSNAFSPSEFTNSPAARVHLFCPGVGRESSRLKNVNECDYTYVNWEPFFGTNSVPNDYPLIYDRRLSNHRGLGINVVTCGGSCFWDYRARWLRAFAAKHPEYHVPVAE